jgi:hypothetical protein
MNDDTADRDSSDRDTADRDRADEAILANDVSDEALEAAAAAKECTSWTCNFLSFAPVRERGCCG